MSLDPNVRKNGAAGAEVTTSSGSAAAKSVQVRGPMESDVAHVSTYLGR